jgi:hypothetical protein
MGTAVKAGAIIMKYRTLTRSANLPMCGFIKAGICIAVERKPACVRERENFSIRKGRSGARKLVYMS